MDQLFFMNICSQTMDLNLMNRLMLLISHEKRRYIKALKFDISKKLSLFSELILRYEICNKLKINNSEIVFWKNKYGKAYLKGYPLQFNISHTKNAIVVAFSNNQIGIDIEKLDKKKREIDIAKRFFTSNEYNFVMKSNTDIHQRFYEIWTKKESYTKYLGKGFSIPLRTFDVTDGSIKENFSTFKVNGYIISVCKKNTNPIDSCYLNEYDIWYLAKRLQQ